MKVLAVGDIHTKIWMIEKVEKLVDNYDAVIFVGDYADDWGAPAQDSILTWLRLKNLQEAYPHGQILLVTGNHDYIYVNKTPTKQSGYNPTTQLLINTPEHEELRAWLKGLPEVIEFDGVYYSHAGLNKNWEPTDDVYELWSDHSPLWIRPGYLPYKKVPQVFGHTPIETCREIQKNVWCIDTFSTYPDGTPIGDQTVLEITDGKQFKKISLG